MVLFSKFKSATLEARKRLFKLLTMGGAMTAKECLPFGIDGFPLENMTAVYSNTSNASERVVIGYVNAQQLAAQGEVRMYSITPSKPDEVAAYVWCKADATVNLNGSTFTAVRYENLNTGLQAAVTALNGELTKIQTAIVGLGGTYAKVNVTLNIANAQSPTVKLK